MDEGMTISLEEELVADLTAELKITDENFNSELLLSKVRNALREVKKARKYPGYYTEEQITVDMYDYYSNIRSLALYDYAQVGAYGEESHSENSTSRSWMDRNKCFAGVIPLSRV